MKITIIIFVFHCETIPFILFLFQTFRLLHEAIVQGIPEAALALIRAAPHPRLLDTPNDDADSPLHLAVTTGQWRIVRWLIVAGSKPGPRNINGDSPLHLSARLADVQCCKAINDPVRQQERDSLLLNYSPPQQYQTSDLNQWNYEGKRIIICLTSFYNIW